MSQKNEQNEPAFDIAQWLKLLSPSGQDQIIELVRKAKAERGAKWLPEIKAEFPTLSWIVDLVVSKDAEDALDEIAETYRSVPVRLLAGKQIIALHGRLRYEIDKPRNV